MPYIWRYESVAPSCMCRVRERPWSIAGIGMSSVGDRPTALHRFDEMADRQGVESGKQAADLASCSDRRVQRSVPNLAWPAAADDRYRRHLRRCQHSVPSGASRRVQLSRVSDWGSAGVPALITPSPRQATVARGSMLCAQGADRLSSKRCVPREVLTREPAVRVRYIADLESAMRDIRLDGQNLTLCTHGRGCRGQPETCHRVPLQCIPAADGVDRRKRPQWSLPVVVSFGRRQ
jgi:hypothetical protein